MNRQSTRPKMPSVVLLGAASGLSPFGVTILVPLLAGIAEQFNAGFGRVQFLISSYLLGLAIAQPFTGFLCDRFGRRSVMLWGFAIFVAASTLAAFATSLDGLILLRFLQAAGVSVGTVASRAVVRDTRGAAGAAETLSYIVAAMGIAPILAPIAGGFLGSIGGYQSVMLTSAAIGVLVLLWSFISFPETLDAGHARPRWADWMKNYRTLLTSGSFMAYSLVFGFIQGSFFAFLAVGSIVFSQEFGMSERAFGLVWGILAIAYVLSAVVSGRLTREYGSDRVVGSSIFVALAGGWLMFGLAWLAGTSLPGILIPLALVMVAAGGILPGALTGAVNAHPEMAGTASGISSAVGIVVGGMFTVIAGFIYNGEFLPVASLVAASVSLTAITWWLVQRFGAPITGPVNN